MKGKKSIAKTLKEYIIITIGLLCYVGSWVIFILPNELVGGGVSGIGAIIQYSTGFPVSYSFFIINTILLLIALKVLGKGFGAKTVYAIFVTSALFRVLPDVIPPIFLEEMAKNGPLLCSIIGGIMSGFGIAVSFTQGGSTGGTDIVALMVSKYRNISPGRVIMILDIFIIASSLFIPNGQSFAYRIAIIVYAYVLTLVVSITTDAILSGTKQSVQIFIFSKKYEEVADLISKAANRGVTVLSGQGWYTKKENKILMVVARRTETKLILNLVKSIDNEAFISVGSVSGVYGQGFDIIKK